MESSVFMKKLFVAIALLFSVSTIVNAEIFKWIDKKGKVHYGDKPISGSTQLNISERKLKPSVFNKNNETREERRRRLIDAMTEDRLEKKEIKLKAKKKKAKRNRRCVLAKDQLRQYRQAGSLYDFDRNGNRYDLSEDAHKKSISDLEKLIKKNCK